MIPMSAVVAALQGALVVLRLFEAHVSNDHARQILREADTALTAIIDALKPHQELVAALPVQSPKNG